jgi:DNA-binding beta-propeller fold protein YncE/cytochrome c551/c552
MILAALILTAATTYEKKEKGAPFSPTDFIVDATNEQLVVAQKTKSAIDFVDLATGKIKHTLETKWPPTGICANETTAYVSCSYSEGEILIVDLASRHLVKRLPAGHGAICPVLSPDSEELYVANQYTDDISVFNLDKGGETHRIPVKRQPMTMDVTPDGKWLYVANLLPSTRADIDTVASEVSIIDLSNYKAVKHLKLANGSNALRGLKISSTGKHAYIAHNLGRFQVPTTQLEQGWMNTSALSIIDVAQHEVKATILLDEPEYGAAGSWGIAAQANTIAVTHSATHDYSLIDEAAMLEKMTQIDDLESLSYDLTFLNGIRQRVAVKGEGPRAIKIVNGKLYTGLYFSDIIQVDDLVTAKNNAVHELNSELSIDSVRLGEMAFHDARHCFQQWQACTGCHPNDARTDGLNWDLLNDGIGNSKNCKSLVLSHVTPPAMITGVRPTAEIAVRAGFRHIQFAQVDEELARAVDHYLKSLEPVPSPYLVNGQLSDKAEKGKAVFHQLNCNYCHPAPYYTDGKKHTIGKQGPSDRTNTWDTPTLREIWRTAPYLHDGRSAALHDLFSVEQHGLRQKLNPNELEELIEYVLSL